MGLRCEEIVMGNRWTPSVMTEYIDGQEHAVTPEMVGLASAESIRSSFYQACRTNGFACKTRVVGNVAYVQSIPLNQVVRRTWSRSIVATPIDDGEYDDMGTDASILRQASDFFRLSEQLIDTTPGSRLSRELTAKLVQLSRINHHA